MSSSNNKGDNPSNADGANQSNTGPNHSTGEGSSNTIEPLYDENQAAVKKALADKENKDLMLIMGKSSQERRRQGNCTLLSHMICQI
jgi:hypothetical protein